MAEEVSKEASKGNGLELSSCSQLPCGCLITERSFVSGGPWYPTIEFCPLHANADKLLEELEKAHVAGRAHSCNVCLLISGARKPTYPPPPGRR